MAERFVLLGLAQPRAAWFSAISRWASSGALPVEFVKAVSADEIRVRLGQGRPYSAVVLDGGSPMVDRDLIDVARSAGSVVLVVTDPRVMRDWIGMGATAALEADFRREELLDLLVTHGRMVGPGYGLGGDFDLATIGDELGRSGSVAAVCGTGGTGSSTVSMALAQGMADQWRRDGHAPAPSGWAGSVLLVDGCRRAQLGMLHDTGDLVPGIQELVDAHRHGRLGADDLRALSFPMERHGYDLLLGLRRPRYWTTLRRRSYEAAFDGLRRHWGLVVCDVDGDFEDEAISGSVDVEERNLMSRTAIRHADIVLAVGRPGAQGIHALTALLHELVEAGVDPERTVPVLNQVPRAPKTRATLARALDDLVRDLAGPFAPTVFLPRRPVDRAVRDGAPVPGPLPSILAGAFSAVVERVGDRSEWAAEPEPALVVPGSLGSWFDDVDDPSDG